MGTADARPPPHIDSEKKNRARTDSALVVRANLILLSDFVDNWNPTILNLADLFITVDYSTFICLSVNL